MFRGPPVRRFAVVKSVLIHRSSTKSGLTVSELPGLVGAFTGAVGMSRDT